MAMSFGEESKIGIVGAGAIGGITSALLHREGYDIEVACNSAELAGKLRSSGLHLFGLKRDFRVTLPAVEHASNFSGQKDIILLATKANDVVAAARDTLPFLTENSKVVCMQNGMCEFAVAEVVGSERTVGCIIGWSATRHAPGELELTAGGNYILGNMFDRDDSCLPSLSEILGSIFPVLISQNMMGHRYAKLVINACIAPLGVLSGLCLGEMLAIRKIRNFVIAIIAECMAVAYGMGIAVERFIPGIDYCAFLRGSNMIANLKRHVLIQLIGMKYCRLRSSSLTSLEHGRPTEIDYLNGYIAERGSEHGIPTPVNSRIVELVKEIESGKRHVSLKNLDDPILLMYV
ncbi:ketopantoate reductase family protein [Chloroflexota bacterium]